ncbi:hypothetical protein L6V77_33240 [Myxococcota bacterium]|nr:hypothetical protein [Myxococcota bacterium]
MDRLKIDPVSRSGILDRYLTGNQIRYFTRAFMPWNVGVSMRGLGPRIDEAWRCKARELGAGLESMEFDEVLQSVGSVIRDELKTPAAGVDPARWRRWVDDMVWRLPYVEHAVNARFIWALAALSPEQIAAVWSAALGIDMGASLRPQGEAGIAHDMQVDGLFIGPSAAVCLEIKVRGVGRESTKLEPSQLAKYEELARLLRSKEPRAKPHLAFLIPESAASSIVTAGTTSALDSSAAPVRLTEAAIRGLGSKATARSHIACPSGQPSAFDSIHMLTFADFVATALLLTNQSVAATGEPDVLATLRGELVRVARYADGPTTGERDAHARPAESGGVLVTGVNPHRPVSR